MTLVVYQHVLVVLLKGCCCCCHCCHCCRCCQTCTGSGGCGSFACPGGPWWSGHGQQLQP